jgi:hypothetical protein
MATPTTLPASFVSGAVLTAAQMNNLRGAFRVLQVVSTEKTDTFSTASTSFVDVTGMSATITPSATSSKILVIASFVTANNNGAASMRFNLVRGSTNIAQATGGSLNSTWHGYFASATAGGSAIISYLDSPATTSLTTYKLQGAALVGGTLYVGRIAAADERSISTFTVMEISA